MDQRDKLITIAGLLGTFVLPWPNAELRDGTGTERAAPLVQLTRCTGPGRANGLARSTKEYRRLSGLDAQGVSAGVLTMQPAQAITAAADSRLRRR